MSKRKGRSPPAPDEKLARRVSACPQPDLFARWARPIGLFFTAALLVTTPLIPSESAASQGTGTPLAMLWLVLLAAWFLTGLSRDRVTIRFGGTDLAIAALVACHFASGLLMAWQGNPRHTYNMLWQWVAFGVGYFLVRQLVCCAAEVRAFQALVVALAVGLSGLACYQYAYSLPMQRADFQRLSEDEKTDRILRETRLYAPEGSADRLRFESRFGSREPLATFALTNSLAAFLAPWLIVAFGIALVSWHDRSTRGKTLAALAISAALVGACLFFTKSRASWLACAMGLPLTAVAVTVGKRSPRWFLPVAAGAAATAIAVLGAMAVLGRMDSQVLSSAPLSVLYRMQYWRATTALIAAHPLVGCGPGNFQEYYTAYKLPEASETVADPHNFLFEIGATAGLPALACMLLALGTLAWRVWRTAGVASQRDAEQSADVEPCGSESAQPACVKSILLGGLAGFLLAAPYGVLVDFQLEHLQLPPALRGTALLSVFEQIPAVWAAGLPLSVAVAWLLLPWVRSGRLPVAVPLCGIAVLLVNLLAAGGIGFPGVSQSLWLLIALALNTIPVEAEARSVPRLGVGVLLFLSLGLVWACHATAYYPVLVSAFHLDRAQAHLAAGQYEFAESSASAAAEADPYSPEPWEQLVTFALMKYQFTKTPARLEQFERAVEELLHRDAHSARRRLQAGDWYLHAFRYTNDGSLIERARAAYQQGVELYPNGSLARARLAWASALAGDDTAARRWSREALRLDELSPHADQKLKLQPVFDPGPQGGLPPGVPGKPAEAEFESLMRRLAGEEVSGE